MVLAGLEGVGTLYIVVLYIVLVYSYSAPLTSCRQRNYTPEFLDPLTYHNGAAYVIRFYIVYRYIYR